MAATSDISPANDQLVSKSSEVNEASNQLSGDTGLGGAKGVDRGNNSQIDKVTQLAKGMLSQADGFTYSEFKKACDLAIDLAGDWFTLSLQNNSS